LKENLGTNYMIWNWTQVNHYPYLPIQKTTGKQGKELRRFIKMYHKKGFCYDF